MSDNNFPLLAPTTSAYQDPDDRLTRAIRRNQAAQREQQRHDAVTAAMVEREKLITQAILDQLAKQQNDVSRTPEASTSDHFYRREVTLTG